MSETDPVHAPLAAPTYLTHVTVPVFRRGRALGVAAAVHVAAFALVVLILNHHFRHHTGRQAGTKNAPDAAIAAATHQRGSHPGQCHANQRGGCARQ